MHWHQEATGSELAQALLDDFEITMSHMVWVMPKALLQYQDADAILATKSRKELVDELCTTLAEHQIVELKKAWKDGVPLIGGQAPDGVQSGSDEMYKLINSYTVLEMAQSIVEKNFPNRTEPEVVDRLVRNSIISESFALMSALAKHAKSALARYDDMEIAVLVANKRLTDFKNALALRNVISMDSPGTYSWIMFQSEKNRVALGTIPSFDELFASVALPDIAERSSVRV